MVFTATFTIFVIIGVMYVIYSANNVSKFYDDLDN